MKSFEAWAYLAIGILGVSCSGSQGSTSSAEQVGTSGERANLEMVAIQAGLDCYLPGVEWEDRDLENESYAVGHESLAAAVLNFEQSDILFDMYPESELSPDRRRLTFERSTSAEYAYLRSDSSQVARLILRRTEGLWQVDRLSVCSLPD